MEWGTNMKGYYPTVPACLKCVSELKWLFSGFKAEPYTCDRMRCHYSATVQGLVTYWVRVGFGV